jgi:hemerythrin-like domain-containing protein
MSQSAFTSAPLESAGPASPMPVSIFIKQLKEEHLRLARLVQLLEGALCLRTDATAPNIGLLVDTLFYLTRLPDVTHHVVEDRIVERLLRMNALPTEIGLQIETQHATLISEGRDLLRDLEAATRGGSMSQELVDMRIRLYAERLRHNMAIEELTLFPAAEKNLNADDWRAIEGTGGINEADPLFGSVVDKRFSELYEEINEELSVAEAGIAS